MISYTFGPTGTELPAGSCSTTGGTCQVTVSSDDPGTGTLLVTQVRLRSGETATVDGGTLIGGSSGGLDATKTWVAFDVAVTPDAEVNALGDEHTFRVTVQVDSGGGLGPLTIPPDGGTVDWVFAPSTGPNQTGTCTLVDPGICDVVIASPAEPGTGTFTATSLDATVGGTDLPVIDLTTTGQSGQTADFEANPSGDKEWVRIAANVADSATNQAGDEHVFTISAELERGDGSVGPASGATAYFTWTGDGAVTGGGTPAPPPDNRFECTLDAAGECDVTVDNATTGSGEIEIVQIDTTVDGDDISATPTVSLIPTDGGSLTATKTWVDLVVDVFPDATNLLGDPHTFTLEAGIDRDGDGIGDEPAVGATFTYSWSGATKPTGFPTCGPADANGQCTVVVDSATPVQQVITITEVTATVDGSSVTSTSPQPDAAGGSVTAAKRWIAFDVELTPSASNPVGVDHVFTITALRNYGPQLTPLTTGGEVTFEWTGTGAVTGGATSAGGDLWACTLDVNGECDVTVSSADPGTGDLVVTELFVDEVFGSTWTVDFTQESSGQDQSVELPIETSKTWSDWRVQISDDATNAVGEPHDFTLTLQRNDGNGWVNEDADNEIDVVWDPGTATGSVITAAGGAGGSVAPDGLSATCVTDDTGECVVTVDSAGSGTGTLTAESVNVSLGGYAPPDGAVGDPFDFDIDDESATKTWAAVRGTVETSEVNILGDDHTFLVTIEVDSGGGNWVPAPAGTEITFDWSGTGTVGAIDAIGPTPGDSCTLRDDDPTGELGTCTVTITSPAAPGSGVITLQDVTSLDLGGGDIAPPGGIPIADANGSAQVDSRVATKTWVRIVADVFDTATNVINDEHIFTIQAWYDNGSTLTPVPDAPATSAAFTWTGAGPTAPMSPCTAFSGGTCEVTVNSGIVDGGVITVTSVTTEVAGDIVTGDTADSLVAVSGGSLSARKDWVRFELDVETSATNLTGEDHPFTITGTLVTPDGPEPLPAGSTVEYTFGPTGTAVPDGACTVDAAGQCVVTVSSADPGSGTIELTGVADVLVDRVPLAGTVADGDVTATADGSLTAVKQWVEFDVDITPLTATNIVGDSHDFEISVRVDTGSGLVALPIPPNSGTVDWSFDGPDGPDSGTCTLVAGGTCTVTQNSATPGTGTLTAETLNVTFNGEVLNPVDLTDESANGVSTSLTAPVEADKTWVQLVVDVSESATNLVGDDHEFTIFAWYDDGTALTPVPDDPDSSAEFTWTGTGTADPATTCTAFSGGECVVTVSSATPGTGTLLVTGVTTTVNGDTVTGDTAETLVPADGGSDTADKTWIDLTVNVEPSATNIVGDDHEFTLSAFVDLGAGPVPANGASFAYTWDAGTSTGTADPVSPCVAGAATNECVVTVTSDTPGTGTVTIDTVTYTAPDGTTFTDVVAAAAEGDSTTADKTWVQLVVDVAESATNIVGDDHQFTIFAWYDDGSGGLTPVPDNASADFTWTGVGTPNPASPCTPFSGGECVVTVSSDVAGTGTLDVTSVTATIAGDSVTGDAADTGPSTLVPAEGGSLSADKTWVQLVVDVVESATNLTGEDHEFTISAWYDDGTGLTPVEDDSSAVFSWTGVGTPNPASPCTPFTGGECVVTVSSNDPGSGTIEVTSVTTTISGDGGGTVTGDVTDSDPATLVPNPADGSLTAVKQWVEFDVDIAPLTATNIVGDSHDFEISVRVDTGSGLVALPIPPNSGTVDWSFDGPDGPDSGTCTLVAGGTCTVTQNSATPGTGTLTAETLNVTFNGEVLNPVDLTDESANGVSTSLTAPVEADKTWVQLVVDVSESATNLVGDDHEFTIFAWYDDGTALTPVPDNASAEFTWTGVGTADPTSPCTAFSGGECVVTVDSDVVGSGVLEVTGVTATINGDTVTGDTAETLVPAEGGSTSGEKTWVQLVYDISESATNLIGDPHTFTISAWYDDGSGSLTPVPEPATADFSWTGTGTPTTASPCTLTGGTCEVEVTSTTPGVGELTVTAVTAEIDGDPVTGDTPETLVVAEGGNESSTKTWIEVTVDVTGPAQNLTGDPHEFTLSAFIDSGSGPEPAAGPEFNYTWTGIGTADPASPCIGDANGECVVTVSSDVPGTGTLTIDTVTVTAADGTTFTDVVAVAAEGGITETQKTWVAFDVDITPENALNLRTTPHTFTIQVQVDAGSGLVDLAIPPSVGEIDWEFTGPDGPDSGTCTLGATGSCDVVQVSDSIGDGVLTATELRVTYGGIEYTIDLTQTDLGQSESLTIPVEANKTWGGYELVLDPLEEINLYPAQSDHTIGLQLTAEPQNDLLPIDGQEITVTLTSDVATITAVGGGGVIDDPPVTATCITDATGYCEVTITSTGPGAATLDASYLATLGNETLAFPANDPAEKTWRTYRVTVDPPSAENLLGEPHTFTVTIEQTDDGETWIPVEGAVPTVVVSAPAEITDNTCDSGTDASGQCTVTVTSDTPSSVTLSVTYTGVIGEGSSEFGGGGEKTWIDYQVTIDPPSAENLVGSEHVKTVTVEIDRGGGNGWEPLEGAIPAVNVSGVGELVNETCSTGTNASGQCTVTIRSDDPGDTTVTASFEGSAVDSSARTYEATGSKAWLDYRIDVDPQAATNYVGDPHVFTVTLEVDRGEGWGPAEGEEVDITVSGTGQIIEIDTAGAAAGTCEINAEGTCEVTVNSNDPGSLTVTATFDAVVGETTGTYTDSGVKTWIDKPHPPTGSSTGPIIRIGGALALAGLALLLIARRRRPTPVAA